MPAVLQPTLRVLRHEGIGQLPPSPCAYSPKIVIKSVNPEYQTYERGAEEVNIIGRVIWAAKRP